MACTGDWTGNWTGCGEVDADQYITEDLQGGRLPAVIDAGDPALLCSHTGRSFMACITKIFVALKPSKPWWGV